MHVLYLVKRNEEPLNISSLLTSLSWHSSTTELGQTLDFNIAYSDIALNIEVGDIVALWGEIEVFRGVIVTLEKNGREEISFSCLDFAFYLNKTKQNFQFNTNASNAIKLVLEIVGIPIGNIPYIDTHIEEIYIGKTGAEVIKDILEKVKKAKGIDYKMKMEQNFFHIYNTEDNLLNLSVLIADNFAPVEISKTISNPRVRLSIENMVNSVKIVKDKNVIYSLKDDDLINKYGLLQEVEEVDDEEYSNYMVIAQNILNEYGKVAKEGSLEMIGHDAVRAGTRIFIDEPVTNLYGNYLIKSVTHTESNGLHTMSLDLEA